MHYQKSRRTGKELKIIKGYYVGNEAGVVRVLYCVVPGAGKAARLLFRILFLAENISGTLWQIFFPT